MQLYFDTNIYSFIREKDETTQVAKLLDACKCTLVASSGNLFEIYAIESPVQQAQELHVLTTLACEFERHPESRLHALEVRREIQRLRPNWLRSVSFTGQAKRLLKSHKERWRDAKRGTLPPRYAYAAFRRDFEGGVANSRATQKDLRAHLVVGAGDANFTLRSPHGTDVSVNMGDPEAFWRVEGLQSWHSAIEGRVPASRDYADWLAPYLRPHCFGEASYAPFWLTEIATEAVPLNRLVGLVSFYQLRRKISHGNAGDQLHAGHWLRSDLFLTADRAFHDVLAEVAHNHYPERPLPALVDRSAASCVTQLEATISGQRHPSGGKDP